MMSTLWRGLLLVALVVTLIHPCSGQDSEPTPEVTICTSLPRGGGVVCQRFVPNNETGDAVNSGSTPPPESSSSPAISTVAAIAIFSVAMTLFVVFIGAVCCYGIYKFGYKWGRQDGARHVGHLHGEFEDSLTLRKQFEDVVGFADLEAQEAEEPDLYMGNAEESINVSESGVSINDDQRRTDDMYENSVTQSQSRGFEENSASVSIGMDSYQLYKKEAQQDEGEFREENLADRVINEERGYRLRNEEDDDGEEPEIIMMEKHRRRKSLMTDADEGLYSLSVDTRD